MLSGNTSQSLNPMKEFESMLSLVDHEEDLLEEKYEHSPRFTPNDYSNYSSVKPSRKSPEHPQSMQSQVKSSLQAYNLTYQTNEATRFILLPLHTMEILRISVSCFPETMLLTSSLTVETIRSYYKKMRRPAGYADISENTLTQSLWKSFWSKFCNSKRADQLLEQKPSAKYSTHWKGTGAASAFLDVKSAAKPWWPIQDVFGQCSDYLCNALYAHIVAYNYVSALVAQNDSLFPGICRPNVKNLREFHESYNIPKKAASLLGLVASTRARVNTGRFSRQFSLLGIFTEDDITNSRQTTPTPGQHSALRVIQDGLLHCIIRLIAMARVMVESHTEPRRKVDTDAEDADVLFVRSLCEIVQIAEEVS